MAPTDPFLYFAYGSNMLTARLRQPARAPSATPVGIGCLAARRLTFAKVGRDGSGKCDAEFTGNAADHVHGVLYEVAIADRPALDLAEDFGRGYRRDTVEVRTRAGTRRALTYLAVLRDPALRPFCWYRALVLAGAREHGLEAAYIERIGRVPVRHDPDVQRRRRHEALLRPADRR